MQRCVIKAIHTLIYSDDPPATRAFLRDVLELPFVEEPDMPGWLIFKTGPSELGVHPTSYTYEGEEHSHPRHHSLSLMCDDIERDDRRAHGEGSGLLGAGRGPRFRPGDKSELPGAGEILLYEPRHPEAHSL